MTQRLYPPFEIQSAPSTLAALSSRVSGIAVGGKFGTNWLRDSDGNVYPIYIAQRDLEFKFEVFSLAVPTMAELAERLANWVPPEVPTEVPDATRNAMLRRPELPSPPRQFEPWPFDRWRVDVLRRAEFVLEDVEVQGAFGEAPGIQSAVPPGHVPTRASAACEVAVGLLFTALTGDQLLIGADWAPFNTIVTRDCSEIAAFVEQCEVVELAAYIAKLQPTANDR